MLLLAAVVGNPVNAAGATLSISPQTGSYQAGQAFSARVVVDGGGQAFNAAKATVVISPGLQIQSLTLGDCGFAFVREPTQSDPSFAGAILGGSSTSCTLYTLNLVATTNGTESITFLNSSVKSVNHAVEILGSAKNSVYSISGSSTVSQSQPVNPIKPPQIGSGGIKLYTLVVNLDIPATVPLNTLEVVLDLNRPTQQILGTFTKASLSSPITFTRVPQGAHTITMLSNNVPISQQITEVEGPNGTIVFGISAKHSQNPLATYVIVLVCLIVLCAIGVFLYMRNKKKKTNPTTTPA